jgi:hypothetical protein
MATLLVVIPVGPRILLAADGKRTDVLAPSSQVTGCKILRTESFVFAAAGFTEGGTYSAHAIARHVASFPLPLTQQVQLFQTILLDRLPDALNDLQNATSKLYPHQNSVLTAILIGGSARRVYRMDRRFAVDPESNAPAIVVTLARDYPDEAGSLGPISLFGSAAAEVHARLKEIDQPDSPVDCAHLALKEGAALRPDEVGCPYSMVIVGAEGSRWVPGFRPPACPEMVRWALSVRPPR